MSQSRFLSIPLLVFLLASPSIVQAQVLNLFAHFLCFPRKIIILWRFFEQGFNLCFLFGTCNNNNNNNNNGRGFNNNNNFNSNRRQEWVEYGASKKSYYFGFDAGEVSWREADRYGETKKAIFSERGRAAVFSRYIMHD